MRWDVTFLFQGRRLNVNGVESSTETGALARAVGACASVPRNQIALTVYKNKGEHTWRAREIKRSTQTELRDPATPDEVTGPTWPMRPSLARESIDRLVETPTMELVGKTAMADNEPLKGLPLTTVRDNIVFIRNDKDGFLREGWTLVYFMDSTKSANDMKAGKIPYILVPIGMTRGGGRGSPITAVWSKKFHKPGTEHILGLIQGHTDDKLIYVDMMSVRPPWKRNGITSLMIDTMRHSYPDAKIKFSPPTGEGEKFIKRYAPDSLPKF